VRVEELNRSVAALGGSAASARKTAARSAAGQRPLAKAARKRTPARKAARE
jgi:hypothetical protein